MNLELDTIKKQPSKHENESIHQNASKCSLVTKVNILYHPVYSGIREHESTATSFRPINDQHKVH